MARRKKPNGNNSGDDDKKEDSLSSFEGLTNYDPPLLNAPSNNFTCGAVDPYFYKIITYINYCLSDMKKLSKQLYIEESRCDKIFLYYIKNKSRGLTGYVGRDVQNNNYLSYVIVDESRFEWARLEGFNDDRQFVFEKIGVLRKCKTISDFITFMAGERGFVLEDGYILEK